MALKRKQWLLCLGGLLLAVCGIAGGLFYYGEMQKRPVASPLGGTMRVGENVLYLTDAAIGTAPDWESWRQILQKRSFDRVEISGSLLFAGHTLPIQRGEMHRNSAGTWEISLESSLNRSPLLLSGMADPVQETFTGKYAAALSAGEWKQHPFFGALRLQGIARTRGNVSIAGQKITLHPASAMPDEGARIFAGALELQPGQQGVEGDGAAIFLPGGAITLPMLHLANPRLTVQQDAISFSANASFLPPVRMEGTLPVRGTLAQDGKWNFSGKIPAGTMLTESAALAEIRQGTISGDGDSSTGLLRIGGEAVSLAGRDGSWQSGAAQFRRDWRFRPDRHDAPVLQQTAVTFARWTGEDAGKRANAEQLELTLDDSRPGERSFRIAAKSLSLPELTLQSPRISGVITQAKELQGALTLSAAAAQLRLPEGDLATGEFHAGGKFSGSWRNGSWQIQGKECTGQWGDTACLAPEITLETAPGMKLRRAGFPRLTLTFEGGNCDLAGVEFSPGSLRSDAVSGDWLGWKFQASGVRLTPELLQWSNGTCTGHGIALRGVQLDTAAGTFSAQSAKPGTWMDSFSAKTTLQKGTLTFRGKGVSGLLQSGGFFFNGAVTLHDPAETLSGEFTLPAVTLRNPLPLKKLAPAGGDWTLAGKLACTGTFSVAEGVPRWNPAWSFEGSAASAEGSAEQLLLQLTPQGILEGVAGSFRSGRFQGSDGEIAVDLSGKTPRLQRASFSLWSGNWQWDPAAKCFHFRNLSPESILPLQQWQNAISGNFRGEGIFRWEKGMQLQKLEAFSERSARWKLGEMEPLRYVPAKGVDPELFGFAAALARDFLARRTALTVEVLPAGTLVQIRGEGKPAAPVPYVYDGKAIRPALPEDHGFSTSVELDCDYWIPAKP